MDVWVFVKKKKREEREKMRAVKIRMKERGFIRDRAI